MNIEIKEKVENCPASSPMWHNPLDNVIEKYDTMIIQHAKGEKITDARITMKVGDFLKLANIDKEDKK